MVVAPISMIYNNFLKSEAGNDQVHNFAFQGILVTLELFSPLLNL